MDAVQYLRALKGAAVISETMKEQIQLENDIKETLSMDV